MNVKDELDKMAHNIADALKAFHERLCRLEAIVLRKKEIDDGGEVDKGGD